MFSTATYGSAAYGSVIASAADGVIVVIDGIDMTDVISRDGFTVVSNIHNTPDTAHLVIAAKNVRETIPSVNSTVSIYDHGRKIFGGYVTRTSERTMGLYETIEYDCIDWTHELGNRLVSRSFTNHSLASIIFTIFSEVGLTEYDATTHVEDVDGEISIDFDNVSVLHALNRLSETLDMRFFISPEREVYFFTAGSLVAPFSLDDTSGNYAYSSLIIEQDTADITNKVTVKGKGIDAVVVEDATSQVQYGLRERYIRDDAITVSSLATKYAQSIIAENKDAVTTADFITRERGLMGGMTIDITSAIRSITVSPTIRRVTFSPHTHDEFIYAVSCETTRTGTLADLFRSDSPEAVTVSDALSLQDIAFTATSDDTIEWTDGNIYLSDGRTFAIASGSAELTGSHVVYFDEAVSLSVLQISTTFTDAVGQNKLPIAYAVKSTIGTKKASVFPVTMGGKMQIDGGTHISSGSVITDNLAANAVTAAKLATGELITQSAQIADAIITAAKIASIDADTITTGTLTGRTVQNAATGYRVRIDPSNQIQYLNGETVTGAISAGVTGDIIIAGVDDVVFSAGGTARCEAVSSAFKPKSNGSYDLGASNKKWSTAYISKIDADSFKHVIPDDDNTRNIGDSKHRWANGYFEDIQVDDIVIKSSVTVDGSSGGTFNGIGFVTNVRLNGGNVEKKYRYITAKMGIITNLSSETGWV